MSEKERTDEEKINRINKIYGSLYIAIVLFIVIMSIIIYRLPYTYKYEPTKNPVVDDMPDAWKKAGMTRQQWEEDQKFKQQLYDTAQEMERNARSVP
jgi:hypothetical protein